MLAGYCLKSVILEFNDTIDDVIRNTCYAMNNNDMSLNNNFHMHFHIWAHKNVIKLNNWVFIRILKCNMLFGTPCIWSHSTSSYHNQSKQFQKYFTVWSPWIIISENINLSEIRIVSTVLELINYTSKFQIRKYLTHILSLASHFWDIGKQCRPRSDAAERRVFTVC